MGEEKKGTDLISVFCSAFSRRFVWLLFADISAVWDEAGCYGWVIPGEQNMVVGLPYEEPVPEHLHGLVSQTRYCRDSELPQHAIPGVTAAMRQPENILSYLLQWRRNVARVPLFHRFSCGWNGSEYIHVSRGFRSRPNLAYPDVALESG